VPAQPPTIHVWGNIMAEGRATVAGKALHRFFPPRSDVTVLAVNLLGDGLRDAIDPPPWPKGYRELFRANSIRRRQKGMYASDTEADFTSVNRRR